MGLAAALLLLLTGCAASGGEPEPFTLFYTAPYYADDDTIPFYPVAAPAVGGGNPPAHRCGGTGMGRKTSTSGRTGRSQSTRPRVS